MSKLDIIFLNMVLLIVLASAPTAITLLSKGWKVNETLWRTLVSSRSKAMYSTISDYGCIDNEIINLSLNSRQGSK